MILCGDVVPQDSQILLPDFGGELVLANLEGPVCRDGLPVIEKVGTHLHSKPFVINGHWAFTLANNHLMDFCDEGMRETVTFLHERGVTYSGAGENEAQARKILWVMEKDKRIAVICCCEHQFGVAGPLCSGVAAQGLWVKQSIQNARKQGADVVIVSSHAGSESTKLVSPRLQSLYRDWIDTGADIIHGHHAHVPQGWEIYRGKPIFYGLGNFIVKKEDWASNPDYLWSLIVHLDISGNVLQWNVEPYGDVPLSYQAYLDDANEIFSDSNLLKARWVENANLQYKMYYRPFLEFSLQYFFNKIFHHKAFHLVRQNFAQCENHIDIIKTAKGKLGYD